MKECFGNYTFEDMDCMQCGNSSDCYITQRNELIEKKKESKPKKCHECIKIGDCNKNIKECIGEYKRKCVFEKCMCKSTCESLSLKPVKVRCTNSLDAINLAYHNERKIFEQGKTYSLHEIDGMLCIDDLLFIILKEYDDFRESPIFKSHFKEIKDWDGYFK